MGAALYLRSNYLSFTLRNLPTCMSTKNVLQCQIEDKKKEVCGNRNISSAFINEDCAFDKYIHCQITESANRINVRVKIKRNTLRKIIFV